MRALASFVSEEEQGGGQVLLLRLLKRAGPLASEFAFDFTLPTAKSRNPGNAHPSSPKCLIFMMRFLFSSLGGGGSAS